MKKVTYALFASPKNLFLPGGRRAVRKYFQTFEKVRLCPGLLML